MSYRKILNRLITEELTISSDVYDESLKLWEKILDSAYNVKTTRMLSSGEGQEGCGSIETNIFGTNVDVWYTFYDFFNEECFKKQRYDFIEAYCSFSEEDGGLINITFPMVSGRVVLEPQIKDALHHEMEHLFQGTKGSQKVINPNADYQQAKQTMYSSDEDTSDLGLLMYFFDTSEQDAFMNGLYAQLMAQEKPMIKISWEFIKNTEIYYFLTRIREIKKRLEYSDKTLEDKCRHYFKRTAKAMFKIAKIVEVRILKKLGKVLAKYHKDIRLKYPIKESIVVGRKKYIDYFTSF